jgi:hypothetical protein
MRLDKSIKTSSLTQNHQFSDLQICFNNDMIHFRFPGTNPNSIRWKDARGLVIRAGT